MLFIRLLRASAFMRGVVTAAGLLTAIPQFVPYEVIDLASGMHAVLVGWEVTAGAIGHLISLILGFPEIPADIASGAIIGLSLGSFFALGVLRAEWRTHTGIIQNGAFLVRVLIPLISTPMMAIFFMISYPTILFWLSGMYVLTSLVFVMKRFPSFRRGIFSVVGFVLFVEGVYLVSTERVQTLFEDFVCDHVDAGTPRCAPEAQAIIE